MPDEWTTDSANHNCSLLEKMLQEDVTEALRQLKIRYCPAEHRKFDEYFFATFYYNLINEMTKRKDPRLYENVNNFYLNKMIRRIPNILDKANGLRRSTVRTKRDYQNNYEGIMWWENVMEINKFGIRSVIVGALANYSKVEDSFSIHIDHLEMDKDKIASNLFPSKRILVETEDGTREVYYTKLTPEGYKLRSLEITRGMEFLMLFPYLT